MCDKKGEIDIKHYYTEKMLKELLSHLVVLTDTRDQTNQYIIQHFDDNGIKHKNKALKTGDYSFYIEKCPELGFLVDTYFIDELTIERKNSVSEIAGNFVEKDERFIKELNRMINIQDVYILIEDDKFSDIIEHNYKSKYNELSFLRTLLTTQKQCDFYLYFIEKKYMGQMIYEICRNSLMTKILK